MRRINTLRARTGTYRDRVTGQEKTSYTTVGHILEKPDGNRMYKLDSLPVQFDGWLFIGELPTQHPQLQQAVAGKTAAADQQSQPDFNDDIPF